MTAPIRLTDEQKSDLENWAAGFSGIRRPVTPALHGIVERIVADAVEAARADEGRIMLQPCPSCGELAALWVGAECSACARVEAAERALVERTLAAIETYNGTPVTAENLRYAATHQAITGSWIFDVLTSLADLLAADDRTDER